MISPEMSATGPNTNHPEPEQQGNKPEEFPLTEDQEKQAIDGFVKSLDQDAVCALASHFNQGRPCHVIKTDRGSFNICFVVEFDLEPNQHDQETKTKWIVRVPLGPPTYQDPWLKLQSEVATLQCLERNTHIPVPQVHAHGNDAKLSNDSSSTHMFLITNFISGDAIQRKALLSAPSEQRKDFYSQIIDILAQLRTLEFPSIGSLMPPSDDDDDVDGSSQEPNFSLGPVISMTAHQTRRSPPPSVFTSAQDYMQYHFGLVSASHEDPIIGYTVQNIRREMLALHCMESVFLNYFEDTSLDKGGPFVLAHPDLRYPNIIVDDKLKIQGIIDWEFTSTTLRRLFTPPLWTAGHDPTIPSDKRRTLTKFRKVLEWKAKSDPVCEQLRAEWYDGSTESITTSLCIARVLFRATEVVQVYYDNFFLKEFEDCSKEEQEQHINQTITDFFENEKNTPLALRAQRQAERCERFKEHIERNGLFNLADDRWFAWLRGLKFERNGS